MGVEYVASFNKSMLEMDFNFPNVNSSSKNQEKKESGIEDISKCTICFDLFQF